MQLFLKLYLISREIDRSRSTKLFTRLTGTEMVVYDFLKWSFAWIDFNELTDS